MALINPQDGASLVLPTFQPLQWPVLSAKREEPIGQTIAQQNLDINPNNLTGTIPQRKVFEQKENQFLGGLREGVRKYGRMPLFLNSPEGKQWQDQYKNHKAEEMMLMLTSQKIGTQMDIADKSGVSNAYVFDNQYNRITDVEGKPLTFSKYYENALTGGGIGEKGEFILPETPYVYSRGSLDKSMLNLLANIPTEQFRKNYYTINGKVVKPEDIPSDFIGLLGSITEDYSGNVGGIKNLLKYIYNVEDEDLTTKKGGQVIFNRPVDLSESRLGKDAMMELKQMFYEKQEAKGRDKNGDFILKEEDFPAFTMEHISDLVNTQQKGSTPSRTESFQPFVNSTGMMKSYADQIKDAAATNRTEMTSSLDYLLPQIETRNDMASEQGVEQAKQSGSYRPFKYIANGIQHEIEGGFTGWGIPLSQNNDINEKHSIYAQNVSLSKSGEVVPKPESLLKNITNKAITVNGQTIDTEKLPGTYILKAEWARVGPRHTIDKEGNVIMSGNQLDMEPMIEITVADSYERFLDSDFPYQFTQLKPMGKGNKEKVSQTIDRWGSVINSPESANRALNASEDLRNLVTTFGLSVEDLPGWLQDQKKKGKNRDTGLYDISSHVKDYIYAPKFKPIKKFSDEELIEAGFKIRSLDELDDVEKSITTGPKGKNDKLLEWKVLIPASNLDWSKLGKLSQELGYIKQVDTESAKMMQIMKLFETAGVQ